MPRVHLVIGPVGSGKSTFASGLSRERSALRLTLDEWMVVLFRPDRPEDPNARFEWYVSRVARCVEQIWRVTDRALEAGTDVVLEIGLVRRQDREAFYSRVDAAARDLTVYVVDAPRQVRRGRVRRRNQEQGETFDMVVPDEIFELASDMWDPPDEDERDLREIRDIAG